MSTGEKDDHREAQPEPRPEAEAQPEAQPEPRPEAEVQADPEAEAQADPKAEPDPEEPRGAPLAAASRPRPDGPLARLYARVRPYEMALVAIACLTILLPGLSSTTLIDPWETHYGEVARRMLDDNDWVHLKWQNESFRSKPVLTFWMIASGMTATGVATDGGYSGELTEGDLPIFAVRIPFVLFGTMGLMLIWWMLARLVSRRIAWLSLLVVATTPFYLLVSRQAITDIPMVACVMGAIALLAVAVHDGDGPIRRLIGPITGYHIFKAVLYTLIIGQALYYYFYFDANPRLAQGVRAPSPQFVLAVPMILAVVAWEVLERTALPVTTSRQLYMFWFYVLVGLAILAKGPPGLGVVGVTCLFYIVLTWDWKRLVSLEIPRGLGIGAVLVIPWHFAMFLRDGRGWFNEYFNHHMFKRFGDGVHGDRGTFDYFASQIGIGMWPWVAILPIALAATLLATRERSRESQVRLLVGIWAIAGFALFALSQTKFHHYVLPVIPAFGILVAWWLSDFIDHRERSGVLVAVLAIGIIAFIGRDLMSEQKQIIELFIYRYDRPWPSGPPWEVDVSDTLFAFSVIFVCAFALLASPVWRRVAVGGIGAAALAFAFWVANGYMDAAAPHWGQRELHRSYYEMRTIHGLEIKYWNLRDLADEWQNQRDIRVRSVLPDAMKVGDPMRVTLYVPGAGVPDDKVVLRGSVARLGDSAFWIHIPDDERGRIANLVERGKKYEARGRRPWRQVDADRLIAWQLNWRGENFWSSGEIYGATEDTRTVFMHTDNKAFLDYLDGEGRKDRTYYLITEAGRANGLRGILPTAQGKDTFEILDTSCNKFTLLRFTL